MFWPPVTGWLIALVRLLPGAGSIAIVRAAWVAMDVACAALIYVIALRLGRAVWRRDERRAGVLATVATLGYAIYLPAISYSQFATSETPALLGVLTIVVLVTSTSPSLGTSALGGICAGVLTLTRPSLLPLLVAVPLAAPRVATRRMASVVIFVLAGLAVVSAHVWRNWHYAGELTISTNSAYNLFIGNREMYAEDLDLFHPRATPEQIEFRRQQFSGQLPPFTQTPAESQRLALQSIREHPTRFMRRAVGRLARVFVPKTDVLELLGGEARAGVFAPGSLALLAAANVQWAIVLFGGVAALLALRHHVAEWTWLFAAVMLGALPLCLIAISKPRYSFVFEPLLLIGVSALWLSRRGPGEGARVTWTPDDRRVLALVMAFLAWSWIAFAIFAVTSRSAI